MSGKKPLTQVHNIEIGELPSYIREGISKYEEEKSTNIIVSMGYSRQVKYVFFNF